MADEHVMESLRKIHYQKCDLPELLQCLFNIDGVICDAGKSHWATDQSKRNRTLATIGTFTAAEAGFNGSIRTLALNVKARISRVENPTDKGPDFRIYAGTVEFGAAWKKTSEQGRDYLSVKLDDPSFSAPIYATLAEVDGEDGLQLIWSRTNRE